MCPAALAHPLPILLRRVDVAGFLFLQICARAERPIAGAGENDHRDAIVNINPGAGGTVEDGHPQRSALGQESQIAALR